MTAAGAGPKWAPMPRATLAEAQIHPAIRTKIETYENDLVAEVMDAVAAHDLVIVGMKQNPYVKRARKTAADHGRAFHYLEYGSYLSLWRRRNALKMWTGWPTFPMVFWKGTLIGGAEELARLLEAGELE